VIEWVRRVLGRPVLPPGVDERLAAWRARPAADERLPLAEGRYVVVDVETSGLNPHRDRLLAIGAVPVAGGRLRPGEGFEVVIRSTERVGRDSILIHGIGPQAQAAGTDPVEALMAFLDYIGKDPLVAYHAPFDQVMLERALRQTLGIGLSNPWLDLAWLAPALVPEARLPRAGLDEWLEHFGLRALVRHRATDDALVTAELLLVLLARARQAGTMTFHGLRTLAETRARRTTGGGIGGA
jgi:DNA polymerase-3 subunit epsilon